MTASRHAGTRLRVFAPVAATLILGGLLGNSAAAQEDAEYSRKGADTCLSCHEDELTLAVLARAKLPPPAPPLLVPPSTPAPQPPPPPPP